MLSDRHSRVRFHGFVFRIFFLFRCYDRLYQMHPATLPGGRPSCLFVAKGGRKIEYCGYSAFGALRRIRGSNFQVNGMNTHTCIVCINIDIS
jgi:hypothetical protein